MRKLLLLMLLWALPALAQFPPAPNARYALGPVTAATTQANPGNLLTGTGIVFHQLVWNVSGTVTTCTVSLDTAPDGSTWTVGGAIAGQTCTANGSSTVANVTANYVRINISTLTGGGTVTATYQGWSQNPASGGGGTITSMSSGNAAPLFTTTVGTPTTTPALSFTVSSAGANTILGNFTGSSAAPTYGTATIAAGGTGQTTAAAAFNALAPATAGGGIIYGTGTNTYGNLATGTVGQPLLAGSPPSYGTLGITAGGTGQTSAGAAFNNLAPATAAGGLIQGSGTNTYSNLALGTANQALTVNGSGTGLTWGALAVSQLSGQVAIANGGTGASTATAGTVNLLGSGVSGQCLTWNGTQWVSGTCATATTNATTATPVNILYDSPGTSANGSGLTLTFVQGSASVTVGGGTLPTTTVGDIIQYNNGTAPNFRAVITAVSGSTLTLNTIFPAPNAGPISFNNALPSNSWNIITDPCGQIVASLTNHPNARLDSSTVAPASGASCTISPFVTSSVFSPGGSLALYGKWTTTRSWYIPAGQFKLFGQVSWAGTNAATANNFTNAFIAADNTNFVTQYESNNVSSTNGVTTSASTFTDSNATGTCTSNTTDCAFAQNVSTSSPSGTCPNGLTGPGYCYFQLAGAINGFLEGQNITFSAFSPGSGTWNGGWMLTGVLGTWGAFYCGTSGGCQTGAAPFPSGTVNTQNAATGGCAGNCVTYVSGTNFNSNWTGATITINAVNFTISSVQSSTVLTLGSAPGTQNGVAFNVQSFASMVPADTLQGSFVISANNAGITYSTSTGNTPPSGIGTAEKRITVTGATPFTANDAGSCTLTCTQGTGTGCGTSTSLTVARNIDTSHFAYVGASTPTWTSVQGTYTCYYQSPIVSATNGTTLATQVPMQYALSSTTSNYTISTPVVSVQQLGSSAGTFPDGVMIEDIGIQCPSASLNALPAGVGLQFYGQEMSHWWRIHTLQCSADSVQDFAGHEAMSGQSDMDMYQAGVNIPTSHGVAFYGSAGGSHVNANEFTILGNNNGGVPFSHVQVYGISDLHLGDVHCEQFVRCVDLGPNALGSGERVQLDSIEPGVGGYEGVHIRSTGNSSFVINNLWATNIPNDALLVDDNLAPNCGAGTSYSNGSTSGTGLGFYAESNGNGSSKTRFITDGAPSTATFTAVQQCMFGGGIQAAALNTTASCNGGGVGGSATPTCNGLTGIITVPASTTSVTVTDSSTTAGSVLISQMGVSQAKYGLTPTACSTTAANPVIGTQTAGTSWTFTLTSVAAETCFVFQFIN